MLLQIVKISHLPFQHLSVSGCQVASSFMQLNNYTNLTFSHAHRRSFVESEAYSSTSPTPAHFDFPLQAISRVRVLFYCGVCLSQSVAKATIEVFCSICS